MIKDQPEGILQFTMEFLNSIDTTDLSPHKLKLKNNIIIILSCHLDISERLCNRTRLIVKDVYNNKIKAKIISGEYSGIEVHIL